MRGMELQALLFAALMAVSSARVMDDLVNYFKNKEMESAKRTQNDGNPCPAPDAPFPCKTAGRCIPMKYVCDHNTDCADGYDEDTAVCTAASRPPVVDMMNFLHRERGWIMKPLFAGKPVSKIAHALAVSRNVNEFRRRVNLPPQIARNLKIALGSVAHDKEDFFLRIGMPPKAWKEVTYIFKQLIKSGFH